MERSCEAAQQEARVHLRLKTTPSVAIEIPDWGIPSLRAIFALVFPLWQSSPVLHDAALPKTIPWLERLNPAGAADRGRTPCSPFDHRLASLESVFHDAPIGLCAVDLELPLCRGEQLLREAVRHVSSRSSSGAPFRRCCRARPGRSSRITVRCCAGQRRLGGSGDHAAAPGWRAGGARDLTCARHNRFGMHNGNGDRAFGGAAGHHRTQEARRRRCARVKKTSATRSS